MDELTRSDRAHLDKTARVVDLLHEFVRTIKAWQGRHGYENAWWWPEMNEALRLLKSPPIDAALNTQFALDSAPPPGWAGSGYDFKHKILRETESFTPRLITAMEEACD